jgi:ribonuclease R
VKKHNQTENSEFTIIEICNQNDDGDLIAFPIKWEGKKKKPNITVISNTRIKPALTIGDKVLAKCFYKRGSLYAKPISKIAQLDDSNATYIRGVLHKENGEYTLNPEDKKGHEKYIITPDSVGESKNGDFVKVQIANSESVRRIKQAIIVKNYGKFNLIKATELLAAEKYEIPMEFPKIVTEEAENSPEYNTKDRIDLTHTPLVTIDGEDAKDFDDAIYAKELENGGFELIVAIADVSFYVKPFTELDREAYKRGNSVYFPNMVIPMLPEHLSNGLCSLNPKEERPCISAHITIDKQGKIVNYKFNRSIMKSAARLTYREVENALKGENSKNIAPIFHTVVKPLHKAFKILKNARDKRGALNIETDEVKVKIGKKGQITNIALAERFLSHQIVEEFMITANVAAAKQLQKVKMPVMYRIHEKPLGEKIKAIEPMLLTMGMKIPKETELTPFHLNRILEKCKLDGMIGIDDIILRLQCQAKYSPHNIGHFGLALKNYAHFTSPIRRYSDLLVHRALVKGLGLPDGGELPDIATEETFEDVAEHICVTERRAISAERDIIARFISSYLQPAIGVDFEVKITGMADAGMFAKIPNLGAEGFIPMSSLPDDFYSINEAKNVLYGKNANREFKLGQDIKARLMEASPISGGLIFKYIDPKMGIDYFEKSKFRKYKRFDDKVLEKKHKKDKKHRRKSRKSKRK